MVRHERTPEAAFPVPERRRLTPSSAWLLPHLEPYEPPGRTWAEKVEYLYALAESLVESPVDIDDPDLDHPSMPAAYALLAAFVAHEVSPPRPWEHHGSREIGLRLDLRGLYGAGPAQTYLYDQERGGARLLVDRRRPLDEALDLPRNRQGRALVGEPRNDGTLLVAQLHLAMVRFHNEAVSWVERRRGLTGERLFDEARRLVRWHFQWVVVNDLLVRLVGAELVRSLLPGSGEAPAGRLALYGARPRPVAPLEFSLGAFLARYSLAGTFYDLNDEVRNVPLFGAGWKADAGDLRGFRALPPGASVQWDRFVEMDGSRPQRCRRMNTLLPPWMRALPAALGGGSLLAGSLVDAWQAGLPSGQDFARALGLEPVRAGSDPLWLYVLSEAEDPPNDGVHLVGVGARIVAEVLIGLVATDPDSWLCREPAWRPDFATRSGEFDLAELLRFAAVPLSAADLSSSFGASASGSETGSPSTHPRLASGGIDSTGPVRLGRGG